MVSVRPIRSEEDYKETLARIGDLLNELSGHRWSRLKMKTTPAGSSWTY